jgi:hypothetical protein
VDILEPATAKECICGQKGGTRSSRRVHGPKGAPKAGGREAQKARENVIWGEGAQPEMKHTQWAKGGRATGRQGGGHRGCQVAGQKKE